MSADTIVVFSGLVEPALGEIGYAGLCCVWSEKGSFVTKYVYHREVYTTSVEKRRRNESTPR